MEITLIINGVESKLYSIDEAIEYLRSVEYAHDQSMDKLTGGDDE